MKTLFAGPWAGEFGYELFEWQGKLRAMAKDFDKVIVSSRSGNEILYEDFCDEFVPFDTSLAKCSEYFNEQAYMDKCDEFIESNGVKADKIIRNSDFQHKQKFVKYGNVDPSKAYDIVIHARLFNKYKGTRNWRIEKWTKMIQMLLEFRSDLKICSIGVSEVAKHISNTDNKMDIPLRELTDILASSKLCVGQSSGPMHLASLCGCKHLVWSSKKNRERYLREWNPFNTDVVFYQKERWNPNVDSILNLIKDNL